jgi:hypothetical protein
MESLQSKFLNERYGLISSIGAEADYAEKNKERRGLTPPPL